MRYSPMELAEAFLKTGEFQDALDALDTQLTQAPDDDEARRLRMGLRLRLGDDLAGAVDDFAAISAPDAADWQTLSVIRERQGDLTGAMEAVRQAQMLAPDDERLSERLLDLLTATGAYDEALALIRQQTRSWRWLEREGDLLALSSDDLMATARYGLVLSQLDERAATMRPDVLAALRGRVLLVRAHAYRRLGHTETAEEHYRAAQNLLPADPRIDFNLGMVRWQAGDHDAGRALCQAALDASNTADRPALLESLRDDAAYDDLVQTLRDAL